MKFGDLTAVALAAVLGLASMAYAQDTAISGSVKTGLGRLGYDESVAQSLTSDQMVQIESVLNSGDADDQEMKDRIDQIIAE
jgi:hypothetical protein